MLLYFRSNQNRNFLFCIFLLWYPCYSLHNMLCPFPENNAAVVLKPKMMCNALFQFVFIQVAKRIKPTAKHWESDIVFLVWKLGFEHFNFVTQTHLRSISSFSSSQFLCWLHLSCRADILLWHSYSADFKTLLLSHEYCRLQKYILFLISCVI